MKSMEGISRSEFTEATMERDSMRIKEEITADIDNASAVDFETATFDDVEPVNFETESVVGVKPVDFESGINLDNYSKEQLTKMKEELLAFGETEKINTGGRNL